jgi:hypothetical protein
MDVVKVTDENYPILVSWWNAHMWPPIPQDHLPQGFIIYYADEPIIAGFVYKTDSAFCLFEFIVANPAVKGLRRQLAFEVLVQAVVEYTKEIGGKTLFTSVNNPNLISKLEASGFVKTDTNMTNFVRRV